MAKKIETKKKEKEKQATIKDSFYDTAGIALASAFSDYDVIRVKPIDIAEGVLITAGDKDFYITITEKKKQVEYEEDDIKRNYTAELQDIDENEE